MGNIEVVMYIIFGWFFLFTLFICMYSSLISKNRKLQNRVDVVEKLLEYMKYKEGKNNFNER
jgi:hypothetical protein